MRLLITGGCGFIGSVLCRLLLEKKEHQITVIDNGARSMARPPEGIAHLVHDVRLLTAKDIDNLSPDVVVHLAARCSVPEGEASKEDYIVTNVFGTFALAAAMAKARSGAHFIYAGSSAQPATPDLRAASWYGWTKDVAEQGARRIIAPDRFTCLRLFNVAGSAYGIRESAGPNGRLIPNAINAIRNGTPLNLRGNGSAIRDYVHVLDVAEAFRLAIEKRPIGTFEIGSGVGTSTKDVVKRVAELLHRRAQVSEDGSMAYAEDVQTVADVGAAKELLGWKASKTLDACITSACGS
jgi:UDP-glucose 4-epimerase